MLRQTTGFAIGVQSAKGTAATTNFHRAIALRSRLGEPNFTEMGAEEIEHSGDHQRSTAAQGTPIRTGFVIPWSVRSYLYPQMIGSILRGYGFSVSTIGSSAPYTHTFTLADADAEAWVSVMQALGEDTERFERKARDGRVNQVQFQSSRTGLEYTASGNALNEADSAGTETVTAEVDAKMTQAAGTFTITSNALTEATLGNPRGQTLTLDNPTEEDDQTATNFANGDMAPTGKRISGTMTGFEFSETLYKELNWGGSTAPAIAIPEAQLQWRWQSPVIAGGSTPHSLQWTIPVAQVFMRMVDVEGGGKYLFDMAWRMLDRSSSAPITAVLVNSTASYAGS